MDDQCQSYEIQTPTTRRPDLPERDSRVRDVLEGYCQFLQDKNLATGKPQPYLVRCVAEFLRFALAYAGHSVERTLDLFLARARSGLSGRSAAKPEAKTDEPDGLS